MMDFVNQIAVVWGNWMGNMLWQVSLLILIVSIIDILIRKWVWPQVRYALWLLVLLKLLIPPSWSLPTGILPRIHPTAQEQMAQQWEKLLPTSQGREQPSSVPSSSVPSHENGAAITKPSSEISPEKVVGHAKIKPVWQVYALGIWILGMGLFITLLSFTLY